MEIESKTPVAPRTWHIIGLVGHVANGKSTLVEKLTCVNTRKSSHEKKSGRTTKLGYANCILWKCPTCRQFSSSGQTSTLACPTCRVECQPVRYISFVDCPGHHQYVSVMARGGVVMEGAILVTDVTTASLQPQTIEHLMILEVLGITNTLVVQNKVDLSDENGCRTHHRMLKEELEGTVAEHAPIVPVAAQKGIGLSRVIEHLYHMTEPTLSLSSSPSPPCLTILRSFDVNKPGASISDLKGGVIGAVMVASPIMVASPLVVACDSHSPAFQLKDTIEIRPGIRSANGKRYTPIQTTIQSIMAERESCSSIEANRLYGIGLSLDATWTRSDALVGNLAGHPDHLPPVQQTLSIVFKRARMVNASIPSQVQLVLGTQMIKAHRTTDATSRTWILQLSRPVCTWATRCLVYTDQMSLLGTGRLVGSEMQNNAHCPVPPIPLLSYETLLQEYPFETERYTREILPIPRVVREHRHSIWINAVEFNNVVGRPIQECCTFLHTESLATTSVCAEGIRFSHYKLTEARLQSLVTKYLKHVACKQCKSVKTQETNKQVICTRCQAIQ